MEEIDYTKDVPTEPPKELIPYLIKQNKLTKEIILYKTTYIIDPLTDIREKYIECHCSACDSTFIQHYHKDEGCEKQYKSAIGFLHSEMGEIIYDGTETLCPYCGEAVTAYHSSSIPRQKTLEECFPMSFHKINGRFTALQWYVSRVAYHNGTVRNICRPFEGAVFDDKKAVKLMGYSRYMSSVSSFGGWQQRKRFTDTFGSINTGNILPFEPSLLENSTAENSKLDLYLKSDTLTVPVTYLRIWQKHKNVENLIMQGAGRLINEKILKTVSSYGGYYGQAANYSINLCGINWKEKRPAQMLSLTKEEFKVFLKEKWNDEKLLFYQTVKSSNTDVTITDLNDCLAYNIHFVKQMIENGYPVMKSIRYLEKQKKKYSGAKITDLNYLMDYWRLAREVGDDLSSPEIMYPQNLVTAHDSVTQRYQYKKDDILKQKFKLRYKELSKFSFEADGLLIRPAKTQNEMVTEGKKLCHCVATYVKSHSDGKTAIFFIRKTDSPKEPYYTLELNEKSGKVLQNRGLRNCERTEEIKDFEEKWLKEVEKILKGDVKNGKSVADTKCTGKKRTA